MNSKPRGTGITVRDNENINQSLRRFKRKVEDAGSLVNQHKAQRHQRIQHAGHQAAQQSFQEKSHGRDP